MATGAGADRAPMSGEPVRSRGGGRAVANWLRNYPLAPHYRGAEAVTLRSADEVRLAAWWLPGPPDAPAAAVLAHGALHHARNPRILAFAELLAVGVPVLVPDLRGHGRSGGRTSLGGEEPLDVAAAVAWVTARTGLPVVSIGLSLGGAAVLLAAGRYGGVVGAVALSAPAFTEFERPGAARLHRLATTRTGRVVSAAVLGTRIAAQLARIEDAAHDVASIAPAWVVLVHDPEDQYFGPEHPEAIRASARGPAEIWWEPGAGHGTDLLDAPLAGRILDLIRARARPLSGDGPAAPPAAP